MVHQGLKWDPASRGDTYHVHSIPLAYRCGAYSYVLSEGVEVEVAIPAQRQPTSGQKSQACKRGGPIAGKLKWTMGKPHHLLSPLCVTYINCFVSIFHQVYA